MVSNDWFNKKSHVPFFHFGGFETIQIDAKTLRGIAMEHPNDADEAASVVISEIFPLSSPKNKTSQNPPQLKGT